MFAEKNTKRVIALIIAVVTLLFMLSSFLFIIEHSEHQCTGNDCPICAVITQCVNNLKQIGMGTSTVSSLLTTIVIVTYVLKLHDCLC